MRKFWRGAKMAAICLVPCNLPKVGEEKGDSNSSVLPFFPFFQYETYQDRLQGGFFNGYTFDRVV